MNRPDSAAAPKKILFLYANGGSIITGGQKYEDRVYRILLEDSRFEVDRVWLNNVGPGNLSLVFSGLRNLPLAWKLRKYDIIIFNSVTGYSFTPLAALLRMMGKKVLVVHHHFMHFEKRGVKRLFYKLLEMPFLRVAGKVVVPSPYILALMSERFNPSKLLYWQIPFERRDSGSAPAPRPGNMLYIGTIEERKGLVHLIDAMAMLRSRGIDCSLTVIGKTVSESYREALQRVVDREQLDVKFTGFVTEEEKARYVAEADLFAFPSRHEGYGMVICESMVNALPVVCFDNSAMPYTVVDGENGLLVPDGDTTAFADALARVITDRPLRDRLSQGALRTVDSLVTPEGFRRKVIDDVASLCPLNRNQG